ncbi:PREDICTED: uncharacterized protein LOC109159042 isoform X2 [Ipomoea nil]|uniref:uncharacterized protein LOC109159042 isoform X2 n=1 Tax=Ipomoea nil TaxID=35883 RepID=UPI000901E326|nr:PREDICTED: uncharacterized protein LOC109159042 isoform X2 [Ipomoea nil]
MKFSEDMNFSIWDCPYSQDETFYVANSWPNDLYLNPQFDVIEEDALNEKSCIQVLKALIAKADTEILEVEEEKVLLQSELALADEKWHAMCFTTLIQKITCLDKLIQDLKNANVNGVLHLGNEQMHPKPAERVHEVLSALLQDHFSQSDEQNEVSLADHNRPCSNVQKVVSTQPMEKILNGSTSNIVCGISVTAERTLNSQSSGSGITVDEGVTNAISKDSGAEPLQDEASTCSFRTKKRIEIGLEDFCEDKVEELSNTHECIVSSTTEEVKGVDLSETSKGSKVVDIKQEVKDFSMKQKYKEAATAQNIEKDTKSQLLETKMVSKESPWGVKGQGALLSEVDQSVGESLLGLFNQKDKDERKTQIKIELPEYYPPKTRVTALPESNSSLSLQLRSWEQMDKEWTLYANMVREPCLTEELGLKSPPPKKLKKQLRKPGSGYKPANTDLGNKNSYESPLALVASKSVDSTPQSKTCLDLPVMKEHENLRDYQMRLTKSRGTSKDVQDTGCPSSPSGCIADLKNMTKTQLQAIAKQHKLKRWYSLKKAQLEQLLHLRLQSKDGDM